MYKKVLAVVLSGMMVFGAGMSVCAAESEKGAESLLGGLMNSLGGEEGDLEDLLSSLGSEEGDLGALLSSLGSEESLDELLSSLGSEEGGLGELLSSLGGENGESSALLGMLLGSLASDEDLLGSVLGGLSGDGTEADGFHLSAEDLAGLGEALSDPEAYETLSGLFAADGLGTMILDLVSSKGGTLGILAGSLKNEEGGYDIEKIIKSLEGAEEKEGSIVIDGNEITEEEIQEAVTGVIEMFGLSGGGETEAA